jgi:hypothetical protein
VIFIAIDDTDNATSGGTGRVARELAALLRARYSVLGVSRHQLLVDPRVPYTSNNSCNVIHLQAEPPDLEALASELRGPLRERCLEGSDPGLCVARSNAAQASLGAAAQQRLVTQAEAFAAAAEVGAVLWAVGGTGDGVIGAMSGVVLAAGGNDGRFVEVGRSRELDGVLPVEALRAAGVPELRTREGVPVATGRIDTCGGRVRPVLSGGRPVLLVEPTGPELWRVIEQGKGHKQRGTDGP